MLFVAHTTSVPVPLAYALFKDPRNEKGYIVMERITANTLHVDWPSLSNTPCESDIWDFLPFQGMGLEWD
jgi:hypothetical protein